MIPVLADLNDAVRTLILSVINIASLLLLAYVLSISPATSSLACPRSRARSTMRCAALGADPRADPQRAPAARRHRLQPAHRLLLLQFIGNLLIP